MLSIAAAPRTFGVAAADGGPDAAVCVQVSAKFFTFARGRDKVPAVFFTFALKMAAGIIIRGFK